MYHKNTSDKTKIPKKSDNAMPPARKNSSPAPQENPGGRLQVRGFSLTLHSLWKETPDIAAALDKSSVYCLNL